MLIAQITDIHIGFDKGNPDEHNMLRLRAVLDHLVNGPNRPDLLLLSGDLTEAGDPADYARLAAAVSICPFPVWPMTGNHDRREPLRAAFPHTPPSPEAIKRMQDGEIAGAIAALKMSDDQLKLWAPVEKAIRDRQAERLKTMQDRIAAQTTTRRRPSRCRTGWTKWPSSWRNTPSR